MSSCCWHRAIGSRRQHLLQCAHDSADYITVWMLFIISSSSSLSGSATDVQCLKDLKRSLGDPNGALSSWSFSHNGKEEEEDYEVNICRFAGVECWPEENVVLSLHLGNLGLQGSFPNGLQNCSSMEGLDQSSNSLSGPLPADIYQQIPDIVSLNLSNNGFSGEIPGTIAKLAYLNALDLQHNSLSGPIPGSLQRFAAADFAGNDGLCGAPLDRTCEEAFRVRRRRLRLRSVVDPAQPEPPSPHAERLPSVGAAAGFVVGFVVAYIFRVCV